MSEIYQRYLDAFANVAPDLDRAQTKNLISPDLVSPFQVGVSQSVLDQAQKIVKSFYQLRRHPEYIGSLEAQKQNLGLIDPGNASILMSYDFHLNDQGDLKLIEINTNAAFLAMGFVLYQAQNQPLPVPDFKIEEIKDNIHNELKLFGKATANPRTAIVDDNPEEQKMFAEFLLYQSLFRQWGWQAEILDRAAVTDRFDFIYNRSTDFYFREDKSANLRDLFLQKKVCFSPQPFEYLALADKNRLMEIGQRLDWIRSFLGEEATAIIEKTLLKTAPLTAENAEQIWQNRKSWFFKPKQAFGSKQTYRGSSISRRRFDELIGQNMMAQEYCHAPEMDFSQADSSRPPEELKFNYDLRFYAYQERVQMVLARLYRGQVTNVKTPLGGFACVQRR